MSDEEIKQYKTRFNLNKLYQIQSQQGSWRKKRSEQITFKITFKNIHHVAYN